MSLAPPEHPARVEVKDEMAGLLTCGSQLAWSFPGGSPVAFQGHSPLTVAGAVTDLVPVGYASPCSLLIPIRVPDAETIAS